MRNSAADFVAYEAELQSNPDGFRRASERGDDKWRFYESDTSYEDNGDWMSDIPKPKHPPQPIDELQWDEEQVKALQLFYDMANEHSMPKPTTLEAIRSMFMQVADPLVPMTAEENGAITTRACRRKPPLEAGTIARLRAAKHILHAGCHSPMRAETSAEFYAYWARTDEGSVQPSHRGWTIHPNPAARALPSKFKCQAG